MSDEEHPEAVPTTRGRLIRWARPYDVLNRLLFLGREGAFRESTVDLAGIRAGQNVLDVGCGTGTLTMAAKLRTGPQGEVYGIDAAPEMIEEAERKAAEKKLDIRYRVGLIEDIPFPDKQFDVVVSSLMIHHLPGDLKRQGVAEISRVLKPGGRFLVVDFDPPFLPNIQIVAEAMLTYGFGEIERGRITFRPMLMPIHFLRGTAGKVTSDE